MKRILVYGDSNTWGSGSNNLRYSYENQWCNILSSSLGKDYQVIQNGLPGRIAGDHNLREPVKNGRFAFEIAIRHAYPFEILIIALGTNDIKLKFNTPAKQIIEDLEWIEQKALEFAANSINFSNSPDVIYLGIANFNKEKRTDLDFQKAGQINEYLEEYKNFVNLVYLEHIDDGVHYSKNDHKTVAKQVYEKLKELKL